MKLISISADSKTVKGEKFGYLTGILYLAPGDLSGRQVCPKATPGCLEACLYTAGRGGMNSVQASRLAKTKLYFEQRELFMEQMADELYALERKAIREGLIPVFRPNGTSDIPWERVPAVGKDNIMDVFPHMQMMDYTKRGNRRYLPDNYDLTFSLAENNAAEALQALHNGYRVAFVYRDTMPTTFTFEGADQDETFHVVNGDVSDLRFLDPKDVMVALKAKGKARKDTSGFVYDEFQVAA